MSEQFAKIKLGICCLAIKDGTHGTHPRVTKGVPLLSAKNITKFGEVSFVSAIKPTHLP
ncbi:MULTISPECIES: hypothetical protein [unclassified Halomonas]|uniref:hypothetical protein n=1 Tax=unclassified Halomonas TaxID=2609666 RepID=UPI001868B1E1|nr:MULTISPECIES: hypothetical protein [unclassified Halomonas]